MQARPNDKIITIAVSLLAPLVGLGIALISYNPVGSTSDNQSPVESPPSTIAERTTNDSITPSPITTENQLAHLQSVATPIPSKDDLVIPSSTVSLESLRRRTPPATQVPTATPEIKLSGFVELCEGEIYSGIRHCTFGPYEILRIDPKDPEVRFETVLPMGFDRQGNYGECRDVHLPNNIDPLGSPGPGCHIGNSYPGERIAHMASRYPGAVAAFNGDFFSPIYAFGPTGLTVKNGVRLDGYFDDENIREVKRSSLSISSTGDIRVGVVDRQALPDPEQPWTWTPDPEEFFNTIGGLPLLVEDGHPVDLHTRCILEEGWCPDENIPRARTAFGRTHSGEAIVIVVPEEWGVTIETLSHLLVELGASEAINLDGGGSSQLWFDGEYLVYSSRPIAEGMLVFSNPIPIAEAGVLALD